MTNFNTNLIILGLIPIYDLWSLKKLLMLLLILWSQHCKKLNFLLVSLVFLRKHNTQLHESFLLSSTRPMKVRLLVINYVNQNVSFLFLKGKMFISGFINVINTLMLKGLMIMRNLSWPPIIWMEWLYIGIKILREVWKDK
jgi:hypothetical protein